MKDIIEIKQNKIIAKLSVTLEQVDNSYIGYIPSFDIPFTSPSEEKAGKIAGGLINALFRVWLEKGEMNLFRKKLEKYNFHQHSDSEMKNYHFEHSAPHKAMQIYEEYAI